VGGEREWALRDSTGRLRGKSPERKRERQMDKDRKKRKRKAVGEFDVCLQKSFLRFNNHSYYPSANVQMMVTRSIPPALDPFSSSPRVSFLGNLRRHATSYFFIRTFFSSLHVAYLS
jgi:hypothetical protein